MDCTFVCICFFFHKEEIRISDNNTISTCATINKYAIEFEFFFKKKKKKKKRNFAYYYTRSSSRLRIEKSLTRVLQKCYSPVTCSRAGFLLTVPIIS